MIVAGEATGEFNSGGPAQIRGSILMVDGVLYPTSPDNLWAVDARDGTILWQFYWKTRGGTHTGHRGVGMWRNYLFIETHDNYLVKIDARTGKETGTSRSPPFDQQYFSSMAPVIIGDHVIVGTGNDLDTPGFLQSYDPETGKRQWIFYTVPMNPGDPGLETWPSLDAARHGGGQPWVPGVYDPETRLYIFGTGNPTPGVHAGGPRNRRRALHVLAGRGERRHRQDGVVLPDVAARHARLGLGADARCSIDGDDQRQAAKARLDRRAKRLLLHRRSGDGRVRRERQVRQRDQLGERTGPAGPADPQSGEGRDDSRRDSDRQQRPTGRRPRIRRTRVCSTCLRTTRCRSRISSMPILAARWGSAAGRCGGERRCGSFITAIDPKTAKIAWRHTLPAAAVRLAC